MDVLKDQGYGELETWYNIVFCCSQQLGSSVILYNDSLYSIEQYGPSADSEPQQA